MTDPQTVLVTGVGGYWGARLAAQLAAETDLRVLGIDATPPANPIRGLDFIQADVRNSLLVELLRDEGVTTVCHLSFIEAERHSEANFDLNVIGTMKVFGACAQAGVRKVILKSSTAVYGASAANPAFLTEAISPEWQPTDRHAAPSARNRGFLQWVSWPGARHDGDHLTLRQHRRPDCGYPDDSLPQHTGDTQAARLRPHAAGDPRR